MFGMQDTQSYSTFIICSTLYVCLSVLRWACLYVCLYVCLSTCIFWKRHVHTSLNFLYMLPVVVARSPLMTMQYVMCFRFCGWCICP